MIRTLIWIMAGVVLGGIIHIAVILALPALAGEGIWSRAVALGPEGSPIVLAAARADEPNPLGLDPEIAYAVCRIDLRKGPGFVRGTLPLSFWSVAVYGPTGTILYSTTNRDGIGNRLELGIFNAAQTRLLAQQQLDIAEGLLIVESGEDDILALVRLAPPHQSMRARYEAELRELTCGNLPS
jgi:uncharacterized membrane protein